MQGVCKPLKAPFTATETPHHRASRNPAQSSLAALSRGAVRGSEGARFGGVHACSLIFYDDHLVLHGDYAPLRILSSQLPELLT